MNDHSDIVKRMLIGAASGLAGTLALQPLMTATKKLLPNSTPPIRKDPGEFMLQSMEEKLPTEVRSKIPDAAETAAARMMAAGYGLTYGAVYAALRPKGGSPVVEGFVLGIVCWAAGYLGWLPATGLMPPVWRQKLPQAIVPVVEHAFFGVVAVATYDWLRRRV